VVLLGLGLKDIAAAAPVDHAAGAGQFETAPDDMPKAPLHMN